VELRLVDVMGTIVSFDVRCGTADPAAVHLALVRAAADLHRADFVFSTWKPESPVSRMRRGEIGIGEAPESVSEVLELCVRARDASGGWFDPWSAPGGVDPTGLVKGWAAERALARLSSVPGLTGAMVNAGGDIACFGRPDPGREWRIGIRSPADPGVVMATVDGVPAVATSGAYERGAHIYRPAAALAGTAAATDPPVTSATVIGPELWLADALATGLAAGGATALQVIDGLSDYHGLVAFADGTTNTTIGCPVELFDITPAA